MGARAQELLQSPPSAKTSELCRNTRGDYNLTISGKIFRYRFWLEIWGEKSSLLADFNWLIVEKETSTDCHPANINENRRSTIERFERNDTGYSSHKKVCLLKARIVSNCHKSIHSAQNKVSISCNYCCIKHDDGKEYDDDNDPLIIVHDNDDPEHKARHQSAAIMA